MPMSLFSKRKQIVDTAPYMRRIIDLTTPNMLQQDENRTSRRYSRAIPVAICPWDDGVADHHQFKLGITKDIADTGLGVLTTSKLPSGEVALAFLVDQDITSGLAFFRASIHRETAIGGFTDYGLAIEEYLNENHSEVTNALERLILDSCDE